MQERLLEMSFRDISHPEELDETFDLVRRLLAGETRTFSLERRHRRANGRFAWIDVSVSAVRDDTGALYMVAQIEDVTERRRADEAVRAAEARFRSAFDGAPIGMAITSLDGHFEHVNPALCEITGYSREQLEGMSFQAITPADDVGGNAAAVEQLISGKLSVYRTEKRYIHAEGHLVPVEISSTLVRDSDGGPLNFLTQIQDITERKLFEGRLQHLADHDSLTGLFNRRRFEEELSRELALAERHGGRAALLAIDLDNFKYINDSLGHSIGDELIARVGEALSDRLRKTDVLARLGGDEFAVILPRADEHDALRVAGALLDSVSAVGLEPAGAQRRSVTASIGISIFEPGSGVTAEELHVEADIAMYDAKEAGRGRATVYSASEDRGARMQARITWTDRIREALAEDRFVLYAQEIRSLTGDPVPRFELLVRMLGDDGEAILPGNFLHVAERFDLIQKIDCWVVRRAAHILAEHQAAGRELALSVNLSAKSITDPNLPSQIDASPRGRRRRRTRALHRGHGDRRDRERGPCQELRERGGGARLRAVARRLRGGIRLLLLPQAPHLRRAEDRRRVRPRPDHQPDEPAAREVGGGHRPRAWQAHGRRVRGRRGHAGDAARHGRGLRPGLLRGQASAAGGGGAAFPHRDALQRLEAGALVDRIAGRRGDQRGGLAAALGGIGERVAEQLARDAPAPSLGYHRHQLDLAVALVVQDEKASHGGTAVAVARHVDVRGAVR